MAKKHELSITKLKDLKTILIKFTINIGSACN